MEENHGLRQVQLEALTALTELDRVCKKLQIPYYMTAGTLLGAVRHGGFIPWDDDIDVVMKREDYVRFCRECAGHLAEGFSFQDCRTDPAYPLGFAKVRKQGLAVKERILGTADRNMGAFVDVFPLDACPQKEIFARIFFYGNNLANYGLIKRCNPDFQIPSMRGISVFIWKVLCLLPNKLLRGLRELFRKFAVVCSDGTLLCTVSGRHGYPKEVYPVSWFQDTVVLAFEGKPFPAPAQWDALLKKLYGDYMTPVQDIDSHVELN